MLMQLSTRLHIRVMEIFRAQAAIDQIADTMLSMP